MATILSTESTEERNQRFRAIETQLEIADSLIKGDMQAVGDLVRDTLNDMGITEDQIRDAEEQWREQIVNLGGDPDSIENIFPSQTADDTIAGDSTLEDLTSDDIENLFDNNNPDDDDDKSDEK